MIKIVTDSTCDLPKALIDKYDITVVPLYINFGDQSYLDGVELSYTDFYSRLPTSEHFPMTSAPGIGQFLEAYNRLAAKGASQILSIHLASKLSGTFNNARLAAQEIKTVPVTVLDSQQTTMALGLLLLKAAQAIEVGCGLADLLSLLEDQISRTYMFAALDTLEFLKRSGRVSRAAASLGGFLQIKPVIKLYKGDLTAERVRTGKRAVQRLIEQLDSVAPLEQVTLLHTDAPDRAAALREQAQHLLPAGEIMSAQVTPILGSHVGPGAIGFACVSAG